MRVAALDDIHGNLPALKAVLEDVEEYATELALEDPGRPQRLSRLIEGV